MQGTKKYESKIQLWKEKAKSRRVVIHSQKKRLKEVLVSRDNWKLKYKRIHIENKRLKEELGHYRMEQSPVTHHSYSAEQIQLCVELRSTGGCSYRGCLRVLQVLSFCLGLELFSPSASSIRNWEIKLGYYTVHEALDEVVCSDYALIIDESITIGGQKMLLFLGVALSSYNFDKPLSMVDVDILYIAVSKSWKAPEILVELQGIQNRGYHFKYCCCDNGNNLRKVLKMSEIPHVEDCTHALGKLLEKRYKNDTVFKTFTQKSNLFKRQIALSVYAHFIPPKQRAKGRFLNLAAISHWSTRMLGVLEAYQKQPMKYKQEIEKLAWLGEYADFIKQLESQQSLLESIWKVLKTEGLSKATQLKCHKLIRKSTVEDSFKTDIKDYLKRNLKKVEDLENLICSSDIIESIFGKMKNKLSANPQAGLTETCLAVANYGKKTTVHQIKQAMENTKIVDIQQWRKENMPESILQKKKRLFKNTG